MADVHVLPGVERRDLLGVLPTERLFEKALEAGVTDVVIIGRDRAGQLYVASGGEDVDRSVGMIMRAVSYMTSPLDNDQVIETEPQEPA